MSISEKEREKELQLQRAAGTTVYSAPAAVSRVISGGLPSPSDNASREHKTPQRPPSPSPLPKLPRMPAGGPAAAPASGTRNGIAPSQNGVINGLRSGTPGSPANVAASSTGASHRDLPLVAQNHLPRGLSLLGRPDSADVLSPIPVLGHHMNKPHRLSVSGGIGLVQTRPTSPNNTSGNGTSSAPVEDSPLSAWSSSPHGKSNNIADEKDADWEDLDTRVLDSPTWRELYRIVRMCSIQPSCHWMVRKLEEELRDLVRADLVHVYLVKRDGFRREGKSYPLGEGITGYVHKRKDIVNITDPTLDARFMKGVDGTGDGQGAPTAMLCLPVEADHRADCSGTRDVVAIFQAFKLRAGESFSSKDARVLYRLGEFAGNMLRTSSKLDQAQALYNQSLTTHQRSSALLDVAKVLASETKLDSIVSIIVRQVPELLDCDRCTLYFVDRQRDQLIVSRGASQGRKKTLVSWVFGQSNAPELPFEQGKNELRFPIDKGVAGTVATSGETLNIVDCHQDKRFNATMDGLTGYRTRSMVCVPMVDSKGVIIGVVQAVNKNPLYPRFDQEDEVVLKTFAAQAALAVRNAELFAKTESALLQSDAMLEVTSALSKELKIGTLIQIIVSKVQQLLEADRCTVYIVDHDRKELYTSDAMSFGMGPALPIDKNRAKMIYFPMDRGVAGGVATTGITCNIPDAYADDRFNKAMDLKTGWRTRSILCMAIRNHRSEIVGVLQVMNKKIGYVFDEADEKLLAAFSAQAAVAIENSRLFQQTEKALNHALADQRNLKFMLAVTKNLFSDMHLTSMIDQMTMQV
jgi:GAF domain-containing protein